MSKTFLLAFVFALGAVAQPFSLGVKGGVPFNDAFNRSSSGITQFTVGPMAEVRIPIVGLGVEADLLYNRYNLQFADVVTGASSHNTASSFEIPIVGKYRFNMLPLVHPYVEAGPSFRHYLNVLSGFQSTNNKSNSKGFVIGAGVEVKALLIRVAPEIRYTYWGSQEFTFNQSSITSKANQAQFLIGISF